jgi:hypothetical protein
MLGAKRLFSDRQGALVEWLGFRIFALVSEEFREVIEACRHIGMIGTKCLFPDRQGALEERLGLRILALGIVKRRQVVSVIE